ncbi:MAG: hypothetical protein IKF07_05740 [Eubacterium sp.]|nr:hypothetical protein [Eubacterium sp.]
MYKIRWIIFDVFVITRRSTVRYGQKESMLMLSFLIDAGLRVGKKGMMSSSGWRKAGDKRLQRSYMGGVR